MTDPNKSAKGLAFYSADVIEGTHFENGVIVKPGIAYSYEAYAEVCRLRAEVEMLRDALKPFVAYLLAAGATTVPNHIMAASLFKPGTGEVAAAITYEHLRRAREAMGEG